MRNLTKLKTLALSSLFVLSACGGSGGNGSTTNEMGGIWKGTILLVDEITPQDSIGLISESGLSVFLASGDLAIVHLSTSNNNFSGNYTEYYEENGANDGSISGTFIADNSFTGSAYFEGEKTSSLSFSYDSLNSRTPSLETISGTYSDTENGYTQTFNIDSDGDITGSDTDGCVFGGSVSIPNINYNIYNVKLTASNCGELTGTYNGLGALIDDTEENDTFVMGVEKPDYVIYGDIKRT